MMLKIETKIEKESWNSKDFCNSDIKKQNVALLDKRYYLLTVPVYWLNIQNLVNSSGKQSKNRRFASD
jgi:hypothetical protein